MRTRRLAEVPSRGSRDAAGAQVGGGSIAAAQESRLIRLVRLFLLAPLLAPYPPACLHAATRQADEAAKPAAPAGGRSKPKAPPPRDPQVERWIDIAGFGEVALYRPAGAPRGLALFASGDGGWSLGVTDMAHRAVAAGYWVAGFDTPFFLKGLDADQAQCSDADGLLAGLGEDLVHRLDLPLGTRPVLIGYSSGATLV